MPDSTNPGNPTILTGGERAGDSLGPYHLLQVIGEGGFGIVWLAERREGYTQRVALKVIKPGMDSRAVIARFEQERQALAVMDHPNVARVLDGGLTPLGRPYFVMEHVQGEPITDYCDRHRLTIRQRLELFIPVCQAVQHAHMKGIIHRDLKPSNILVSITDNHPIPKVIDFGVAKAVAHTLTNKTVFTERGQLIGTPEYMSPEQAEMGALDIDTRTDVYSLGVVLYELLTGLLPFDSRELRGRGFAEIQRVIREVDPPTPSKRLTTVLDDSAAAIARNRHASRDELARELRRELEWIPLMAMRKDRVRRYHSPGHMADDLRRYIEAKPLAAGPESRSYLLRKFVRRNAGAVGVAAVVGMAVALGAAGLVEGLRRARNAESAQRDLAESESAAKALALRKADEAQERTASAMALCHLMRDLLLHATPVMGDNTDNSMMEAIVRHASDTLSSRSLDPRVAAELHSTLTAILLRTGKTEAALKHLKLAREQVRAGGATDRAVLEMEVFLADEARFTGLGIPTVMADFEPIVRNAQVQLAPGDPLRAECLVTLGSLQIGNRQYEAGKRTLERALAEPGEALKAHSDRWFLARLNLSLARAMLGDRPAAIAEIEGLYVEQLSLFGPAGRELGGPLSTLYQLYTLEGDTSGLRRSFDRHLDATTRAFGPHSDYAIGTFLNYSYWLERAGDHDQACAVRREALSRFQARFGERHPRTIEARTRLAESLLRAGDPRAAAQTLDTTASAPRLADAPAVLTGAVATYCAALREMNRTADAARLVASLADQWDTLNDEHKAESGERLSAELIDWGLTEPALRLAAQTGAILSKTAPEARERRIRLMLREGHCLDLMGQSADALARRLTAVELSIELPPPSPTRAEALSAAGWAVSSLSPADERGPALLAESRDIQKLLPTDTWPGLASRTLDLATALRRAGRPAEATRELDAAVAAEAAAPDGCLRIRLLIERAVMESGAGRPDAALALLDRAATLLTPALCSQDWLPATLSQSRADVLLKSGRFAEAIEDLRRALRLSEALRGPDHPHCTFLLTRLGETQDNAGAHADAEASFREALLRCERSDVHLHSRVTQARWALASFFERRGRESEAEPLLARVTEAYRQTLPPLDSRTGEAEVAWGRTLYKLGRLDEAEAALLRAEQALGPKGTGNPGRRGEPLYFLVRVFEARAQAHPDAPPDERLESWRKEFEAHRAQYPDK